jgi:hypothetical protein
MLQEWRSSSQGILGCELAEGWMHRFKGRPKRGLPPSSGAVEVGKAEELEPRMKEEEK